eukprot:2650255-Prymnesium_polylepis.1
MDPQQRLLLESGSLSLHGADRTLVTAGGLVGVFVGISSTEFGLLVGNRPTALSVYASSASSLAIASGRISFVLGLYGPCISYETACSASLVALHGSVRSLQRVECHVGVAAGVNVLLSPASSVGIAAAGMTSAGGRCHTFDVRADGYLRAEACASTATGVEEASSDVVVRGISVRQDGRSASLTAPNGQAQQGLLAAARCDAGVHAGELRLSEAHGTGTALGDPIEAGSLVGAVLVSCGVAPTSPLALGGVKANVGHAEAAAGMTGLIKLVVALGCGEAAPNTQLRSLNPHVGGVLGSVKLELAVQRGLLIAANAWVGGVSSFGYAGTIVHAAVRGSAGGTRAELPFAKPLCRPRSYHWLEPPRAGQLLRDLKGGGIVAARLHTLCWAASPSTATNECVLWLLFAMCLHAPQGCTPSAPCRQRAAAALFDMHDAAAPSLKEALAVVALVQHLVPASLSSHTIVLTSGSLAAEAAHGGAWGLARVLRLEHSIVKAVSVEASRHAHMAGAVVEVAASNEKEVVWK